MTEKRFIKTETVVTIGDLFYVYDNENNGYISINDGVDLLNRLHEEKEDLLTKKEDAEYELLHLKEKYEELLDENEQLKQIPIKLDNRIEKLQEDLQKLSEMDTTDLNQQAVEDVATVIGMSLNALVEFRKELKGD